MPTEPFPSISSTFEAMAIISTMVDFSTEAIIVIPLTAEGCGGTVVVIDDIPDDGAVVTAIEVIGRAAATSHARLVAASIRPERGVTDADADLWFDAATAAVVARCELVDWLVVSRYGAESIPDLLGLPPAPGWSSRPPHIPRQRRHRRHSSPPPAMW